jgi:predicted alpha/beta hydrolase family esterase
MLVKGQLLFIQGGGRGTHDDWDDKLVASLRQRLGPSYEVRYPRMPNEADPSYASWRPALQSELGALREGAFVVGHSLGGTMLIKLLTEQDLVRPLGAVVLLAAPFVGEGGWSAAELQFSADLGSRLPRGLPVYFFHGDADETAPVAHLELYRRAVPQAHVQRLAGRDHQLDNDLSEVAAVITTLT